MTVSELRPLVLEAFRRKAQTQFVDLILTVEQIGRETGRFAGLQSPERVSVYDIVWELIAARVVAPGGGGDTWQLPFLHLTEHGRKALQHTEFVPYDPDDYMRRLHDEAPGLDDTVTAYVAEALQAHSQNLPMSSAVMLGGASEQVLLVTSEALADALTPVQAQASYRRATAGRPAKQHFEEFKKRLVQVRKDLPRDVADNLESDWDGVFNLIRNYRNDAGHPARPTVTMDDAHAGLLLFPRYCARAMGLVQFLRVRKGSLL